MRVLLLHPDDSPLRGPWAQRSWDLIVDMGKSSPFSEARWAGKCDSPVLRSDSFRLGIEDVKQVRTIFSALRGCLIDEAGIDWWDIASLLVVPEALTALALLRVASEINPLSELWATRAGWPGSVIGTSFGRPVRTFEGGSLARSATRVLHYAGLVRRFPMAQIKEIFLDKYDSGYHWRARFVSRPRNCESPVVLVPSAYGNVSHMANAYARMLPQQPFLMVATRQSAKQFAPAANVHVQDLAAYAKGGVSAAEIASLTAKWFELRADLRSTPLIKILDQAGLLVSFPRWLRDGLCARDAWSAVIEHEPVQAVLCGDDSNLYTRLPVLLAARKEIPIVDFHHGAFDGRYLLKDLPSDVYLAKNEMERDYLTRVCGLPDDRIMIGAPGNACAADGLHKSKETSVVFFSEPYESAGMRGEEVYAEILPALCRVAREGRRDVIMKLHPFESRAQRCRMLAEILAPEDLELVTVLDGPLGSEILSKAWFGVTVESTVVVDCLQAGVCCFLCGWLRLSPFGYVQQYARFGIGEILQGPEQLSEIPKRLAGFHGRRPIMPSLAEVVDPAKLQAWLTTRMQERSGMRSAS
jgi:hypothetical protein